MADKLKLVANPTFTAKVGIPVPGGDPVSATFTFKHRTKTVLNEWIAARPGKPDVESFMDMVTGWDLDEPFDKEHVETFLENYIGAAVETYRTYVLQLVEGKAKN